MTTFQLVYLTFIFFKMWSYLLNSNYSVYAYGVKQISKNGPGTFVVVDGNKEEIQLPTLKQTPETPINMQASHNLILSAQSP